MATLLAYVFGLLFVGGLLFLAASFAFGRGEEMAPALPDGTPVELPDDRPAAGADLRALRLSVVLRGYRMDEVDWVLDRLAEQLDARDREIARLRSVLHVEPVSTAVEAADGADLDPPRRHPDNGADGADLDPPRRHPDNGARPDPGPRLLTHQRVEPAPVAGHRAPGAGVHPEPTRAGVPRPGAGERSGPARGPGAGSGPADHPDTDPPASFGSPAAGRERPARRSGNPGPGPDESWRGSAER